MLEKQNQNEEYLIEVACRLPKWNTTNTEAIAESCSLIRNMEQTQGNTQPSTLLILNFITGVFQRNCEQPLLKFDVSRTFPNIENIFERKFHHRHLTGSLIHRWSIYKKQPFKTVKLLFVSKCNQYVHTIGNISTFTYKPQTQPEPLKHLRWKTLQQ